MARSSRRKEARERAYSIPLEDYDVSHPELFRTRYVLAVLRSAAQGRAGSLLQGFDVRAVLVGDQVQRHHGDRDQPRGVLVRGLARRHHHPRRGAGPAARKLHRHGSAAARPAAQDRGADVHADASRRACDQHPHALRLLPRQPAAQRDLRLGRQGLGRADHADAGRAVRLPLGGAAQADALVGRRNHPARARRPRGDGRGAAGRADRVRPVLQEAVGRAHQASRRRATCSR